MSAIGLPVEMFNAKCDVQSLESATADPLIQAASARLRKKFLEYAAAVSLDAKHPTEKTRTAEGMAEVMLQEAIELELLAMRTHACQASDSFVLPCELLKLRAA